MMATTTAVMVAKHATTDQIIDSLAEVADCMAALAELIAASVNFSASVFNPSS
jgi:hypothetical protein